MTDLFRFMVLRAPGEPNPDAMIQIEDGAPAGLIADLTTASATASANASMTVVAQRYIRTDQFVATPDSLAYGAQYGKLLDALRQAPASANGAKALAAAVHAVFPNPARTTANSHFRDDKRRVHDSLVALLVSPTTDTAEAAVLVDLSRAIDVLERVAADSTSLLEPDAAAGALRRVVVLPPKLFPLPPSAPASLPQGTAASAGSTQPAEQVAALRQAIAAVNSMIAANAPSPEIQPTVVQKPAQPMTTHTQVVASDVQAVTRPRLIASPTLAAPVRAASGQQAFTLPVQQTLQDLNIDLAVMSLESASARLNEHLFAIIPVPDPFHEPLPPPESSDQPVFLFNPPNSHGYGTVMPAGIADLLVVREHVLRYEPGEIAFVENAAAGEVFKRETVRKNATLNSTFNSTLSSSQTERDLQTSDRFNLQQQTQSAAYQSSSAGANSSAAYGPLVDSVNAATPSTVAASSFGQDITNRAVTNLVTSRQTDVLQQTTSEFDETVDHGFDNSKPGTGPQIVVYQWLDKIVQAKVFTYGKRALYDFIVPEPAVFLAYSRAAWQPELAKLKKPTSFGLKAGDLSTDPTKEYFYQTWATGYGASNVQPPPEQTITIARAYGDKGSDPQANDGKFLFTGIGAKEAIDIPAGYQASTVFVSIDRNGVPPNFALDVVVGNVYFFFDQTSTGNVTAPLPRHQVGQIPVNITVWNAGYFTVNVEIVCSATAQAMAQWQARTHDTILQASRDRMAEYQDQLRRLTADIQIRYAGQSSDEKQVLIRDELEKSCITILTNQHFDALNAIEYSPSGPTFIPQLFVPNVDSVGRYVRFFEQAFEWDQMLYKLLPYFWGRKKHWAERLQLDDADGDFAAFLRAGAARVTVPVRKGYETAVATFMRDGTIPSTADLLAVATGLYVPFYLELMGSDGAPDTAVPYGTPPLEWELRVPTSLVKLRTDNTLPHWKQSIDAANHVTYVPAVPGDPVNP